MLNTSMLAHLMRLYAKLKSIRKRRIKKMNRNKTSYVWKSQNKMKMQTKKYHSPSMHEQLQWLKMINPRMHVLNVKGTSGITRVVTLSPQETCSCPSSGTCYHILAMKMSLSIKESCAPLKKNLAKLRKNSRCRKEKKCGRKNLGPMTWRMTKTKIHNTSGNHFICAYVQTVHHYCLIIICFDEGRDIKWWWKKKKCMCTWEDSTTWSTEWPKW